MSNGGDALDDRDDAAEFRIARRRITISRFQFVNEQRARLWHGGSLHQWSGLEWAGALCGEAGEAANVAKKLRRLELELDGNQHSEHATTDRAQLVEQLANECADTLAYLVLLAARYGIDLETAAVRKFNKISEQMGFPQRL